MEFDKFDHGTAYGAAIQGISFIELLQGIYAIIKLRIQLWLEDRKK